MLPTSTRPKPALQALPHPALQLETKLQQGGKESLVEHDLEKPTLIKSLDTTFKHTHLPN